MLNSCEIKERARRERIRILLKTRNDAYPSPRAQATPYTNAGPAPGRKRKCPACDGTGKVRVWHKCQVCDGKGKFAVDGYVGRVADVDERKPGYMDPERRESELQRLKSSFTIAAGDVDPNEAYGWERNIEARNRQGSYRELERALERLRDTDPLGHDFICWIYSSGLKVEMDRKSEEREAALVGVLSRWMPSTVRLPYRLHEELKDDKRRRIKEMLRCGLTLEEIASHVLLSVPSVKKLAP